MIIKTITCHDVYNYGASLQAYALSKYLVKLGHNVEIIDYKPQYLCGHFSLLGVPNPRYSKPLLSLAYQTVKFPTRLRARLGKRKKEFDTFRRCYLPLTRKRYTSNDELKNNPPIADIYIAGSDQIWNTLFPNGKDPAFYLDFAKESKVKASYAASFSTDSIETQYVDQISQYLNNLDFISVREKSAVSLAETICNKHVENVLDPIFLLNKSQWSSIEQKIDCLEPYLLVYDFDGNTSIKEKAINIAQKNNLKIYSLFSSDYCDRCFYNEGPLSFVSLIHHAKYVVSNSFHATAFAILFRIPYLVVDRSEKINIRMKDLVDVFGLSMENNLYNDSFEKRYNEEVRKSKEYIRTILDVAERRADESYCFSNNTCLQC